MKLLLSLMLIFVISSCSFLGSRGPSSASTKKKHFIITLPGVRGDAKSYGEFHQFVGDTLKQVDPSYEYVLFNWTYPVGGAVNDAKTGIDWNPHLIADKFNKDFILGNGSAKPLLPELGPDDKISILAYSMGGQMIMTWYYDSMFNFKFHKELSYSAKDHERVQSYLARVENIVGLGPVYWGSIDAELGWTFLEKGSLAEVNKLLPKAQEFCADPSIKTVTNGVSVIADFYDRAKNRILGIDKKLTQQQRNDRALKNGLILSCSSVGLLAASSEITGLQSVSPTVLEGINATMKSALVNINPSEINHMRLTSDVINELRVNRITHLVKEEYRNKYRTRWTSIVGVFPCLNKTDTGSTCSGFQSEAAKAINHQLVTIFSGFKRRETDGPVFAPGATADFLYYVEEPGLEATPVLETSFVNTGKIQRDLQIPTREIYVENSHATFIPMIEGLNAFIGKRLRNFDPTLGTDVVIMNKECASPETCKHPNFKHILETLSNCEFGRIACNQRLVNKYFGVQLDSDRYNENEKLRQELGSYVLVMNIRLPKSFNGDLSSSDKILKHISFKYTKGNTGKDQTLLENRLDQPSDLYGNQIARQREILSSYATVREYADSRVVRAFFLGRAWPKSDTNAEARAQLDDGVPVQMAIKFPGLTPRNVTAKVRPTYSTYTDIYIK